MKPGQRWSSPAEPELGLGLVLELEGRRVRVLFPATGTIRQYAHEGTALRRVQFRVGDSIRGQEVPPFTIERVEETADDRLIYHGGGHALPEAELDDSISFTTPPDRLQAGEVDDSVTFDLRCDVHAARQRLRASPVQGLMGGRMALLPHQLYIASDVTSRRAPRVLLADEVGLGKTVEAGLILHRLLCTGRARRILILVPESLVHQWFVEMLRRFNQWFNIFDEERCASIEAGDPGANPFLDDQLVLTSIDFTVAHRERALQLVEAEWDMVVVDEAHHLGWSAEQPDPDYALVEALARRTPSLLLLTATPEQLGEESHFARLRLLDPSRFTTYEAYREEATTYRDVAAIVAHLEDGSTLTTAERNHLGEWLQEPDLLKKLKPNQTSKAQQAIRAQLIDHLIDRHGPCRVMFRNTRHGLEGFPGRTVTLLPQERPDDFTPRAAFTAADPRVKWLADFIREDRTRRILLITHHKKTVITLGKTLGKLVSVGIGLFHEDLPLVQRDRQAAWFAEEDGAQILLCSEIGGEGRNFQFAHDLVLLDLPRSPELLEQRIGRLDRIGQTETIKIHVPYLERSPEAVLARWYRDGLHAFSSPLHGGRLFAQRFAEPLQALLDHLDETGTIDATALDTLISDTRVVHKQITADLESGRDRLLERGSLRPDVAADIIDAIETEDDLHPVDHLLLRLFDHFGVKAEGTHDHIYQLIPDDLYVDTFPGIPREGMIVAMDRDVALVRDDLSFVSWDHPMIDGGFELLLGSEKGNAAFAIWESTGPQDVMLEALYVVDVNAPESLHIGRFLPPTLVRVVVSLRSGDCTDDTTPEALWPRIEDGQWTRILDNANLVQKVLPSLLEQAADLAEARLGPTVDAARSQAATTLGDEHERLTSLQRINHLVRPEELEHVEQERDAIDEALHAAHLRLDSLRLIWKGPVPERG